MGRSAGASARACARALGQVSGRMYEESRGILPGARARARVRASFGGCEWSNVSGVTWGGWLAHTRAPARASARGLQGVSGRMYQESKGGMSRARGMHIKGHHRTNALSGRRHVRQTHCALAVGARPPQMKKTHRGEEVAARTIVFS